MHLYDREIERLERLVNFGPEKDMRFSLDTRRKDFAVLGFRLIPVGAEFAEPGAALWMRKILSGGPRQCLRALFFFTVKATPWRPWFQLHMHPESKEDFHLEGWLETYCRLAELLQQNPGHHGWYSVSWFVDPALEGISPHLSHLWEIPRRNGGALFFMWRDVLGTSGALSTSRTRQQLYAEGRYVPSVYLRVWPRDSAIAWSMTLNRDSSQ